MGITFNQVALTLDQLPIVTDLSFAITPGQFVSLIAPSGAGKTTILKLMMNALHPSAGQITVDGTETPGLHPEFGYMPQSDQLVPWWTVRQNATLYQRLHHQPVDQAQLHLWLAAFGLSDYADFYPRQLSGGLRQRAALLRTMMNPAKYLLLDEPFGALDAMTRRQMQDWLLSLPTSFKRTTILVTHDIEEAIYLSDRIIVLSARPATVIGDYPIAPAARTRDWLAMQAPLVAKLYHQLGGDSHVD